MNCEFKLIIITKTENIKSFICKISKTVAMQLTQLHNAEQWHVGNPDFARTKLYALCHLS